MFPPFFCNGGQMFRLFRPDGVSRNQTGEVGRLQPRPAFHAPQLSPLNEFVLATTDGLREHLRLRPLWQ